jgi:hypothetical protein
VKQPFLDIRNVTVDYDEPSDKILITIGLYAFLPSEGPKDSEDSSDYYYFCNFQTGENTTWDHVVIILGNGGNWSSAHLESTIRGYTYEGSSSPVKFSKNIDSITFIIPAFISTWGGRPKTLLIMVEAGYEHYSSADLTTPNDAYFDRAPDADQGNGLLTFQVPSAPFNPVPVIILVGVLVMSSFATWRIIRRHTRHTTGTSR